MGTTLKSAQRPGPVISGHFPAHEPSSNSSNSMFSRKQGSTFRTKSSDAMAFFPSARETATSDVLAASKAAAKRESAARARGSEARCACSGAEKASRTARSLSDESEAGDASECR